MGSRPWHAGYYFPDEGEHYEWDPDEEEDVPDQPDEDMYEWEKDKENGGPNWDFRDFRKDKPTWPFKTKARVTSIAATPYGLAVTARLIADMQEQLKHLPQRSGEGLKPIYAPIHVPGGILAQVVASSETQITELQRLQNLRSPQQLQKEGSQGGLYRRMLTAAYGHKTEIVVATIAGGALLYLFPGVVGGAVKMAPALLRISPIVTGLIIKTAQHTKAEAGFKEKLDSFDYLGQEVSEIGIV